MIDIKQKHNALIFKAKAWKFDRPLLRALLYSLLLHSVVLGLFRIKSINIYEIPTPAIEVSILTDKSEEGTALVDSTAHASSKRPFFQRASDIKPSTFPLPENASLTAANFIDTYCLAVPKKTPVANGNYVPFDTLPLPPSFNERFYPVQLSFSSSLKSHPLLQDGSSLFKENIDKKTLPPITSSKIEYSVTVDAKTGLLTAWKRKQTLSNKKTEHIADAIIQSLQFEPTEGKEYSGKIWLQFTCTSETLEQLVGSVYD